MELEADLGIDSIKRVEILSGVQERSPVSLEADPAALAGLRTLGEIATYLERHRHGPAVSVQAPLQAGTGSATAAVSTVPEAPHGKAPERRILEAVRAPARGEGMFESLPQGASIAVAGDARGVGPALTGQLAALGYDARLVPSGETPDPKADGLILLHGLAPITEPPEALALYRDAFACARAVARSMQERGGLVVTVTDLGGLFGIGGSDSLRAWLGGLGALAKTAALEWERVRATAIDLERGGRGPAELANALVAELVGGGPELEVGIREDGSRWTTALVLAPLTEAGRGLDVERPFLVATGGARGVTAACLIELSQRVRPRLLLLGRTRPDPDPEWSLGAADEASLRRAFLENARAGGVAPTPREVDAGAAAVLRSREVRSTLEALRETGAEVRYLNVDVTDPRAVARTIATARGEWGPVRGLVHGAGVVADRRIAEKSDDEFERVVATKVLGLDALLETTREDPLEWICLFSSVTGRSGNSGQADYAMANEALNKIARAEALRRGPSCLVKSIGWGPWRGGMVGVPLAGRFEARGARLIEVDEGVRAFLAELASPDGAVEVFIGGELGSTPTDPDRTNGAREPGRRGGTTPGKLLDSFEVDLQAYPYLAEHSIKGAPVVPAALALEWLVRAARRRRPELGFAGCEDLRVLRGIRLNGTAGSAGRLEVWAVEVKEDAVGARLRLELRGAEGVVHYAAEVELSALPPAPPGLSPDPSSLEPPALGDPYGGAPLFHGDAFRVIRSVDGVSSAGITGTLVGTEAMGWPGGPWETDPALIDGALQFTLLHAYHVLGASTLPTRIASVRAYFHETHGGPVRCVAHGRSVGRNRTVSDVALIAPGGRVVYEIRGLECDALPGSGS